jgi:hypothetical protein
VKISSLRKPVQTIVDTYEESYRLTFKVFALSVVGPPIALIAARDALEKCDDDALGECMGNNTAPNYRAIVAMVDECREMLDEIASESLDRVKCEATYHQERLDDIATRGLLSDTAAG